ncbi:casein kinase I isoform delta [Suillus variegatus]|nr:casein kinase I isoform delta [Suillus variegatus]
MKNSKPPPIRVDGRFRLGDVLGSGSYVAVKLEPIIARSSSVQREYHILTQLKGGVGIPCALWFGRESIYHTLVLDLLGPSLHDLFLKHDRKFTLHSVVNLADQLLSRLQYIHSHNYVHGDIKLQNVMVGLHYLRHTAYIIDFGVVKEYCNISTRLHVPFRHNQHFTGTPAFASINSHLGVELGCRDDLESLIDHEKLSNSSILECKANTTIEVLCHGIPVEFATMLIYTRSLTFSEDPDYDHLHSLLQELYQYSLSSQTNWRSN